MTSQRLAEISGVSWATIKRFESSDRVPASRSGTLGRLVKVLEVNGIEFIGDPETSPGVRLIRRPE